jgi:hypothetical protein
MYTYFDFRKALNGSYDCVNRKHGNKLGEADFYRPWKQWCFNPSAGTVFNDKCLEEIAHFLGQLNGTLKAQ